MNRRLHIGGLIQAPDWEIFNANPAPHVNHVGNANDLSRFSDNTFHAIYASHVLEHFDYTGELTKALIEWNRVLIPGGLLYVSVPDLDILSTLFLDRTKLTIDDRFYVMRMIFGGHIDKYDYHVAGINEEFLTGFLKGAGYIDIQRVQSLGFFNDVSEYHFKGAPISLNVVAGKPVK